MTPVQLRALTFIREFTEAHGVTPTRAEVAKGLGAASRTTAHRVIKRLVEDGHLIETARHTRPIQLPMPTLAGVPSAVLRAELARREAGHG